MIAWRAVSGGARSVKRAARVSLLEGPFAPDQFPMPLEHCVGLEQEQHAVQFRFSAAGQVGEFSGKHSQTKFLPAGNAWGSSMLTLQNAQLLTKQEKESLRQSVGTISREIEPIVDAWRNPPVAPQCAGAMERCQ